MRKRVEILLSVALLLVTLVPSTGIRAQTVGLDRADRPLIPLAILRMGTGSTGSCTLVAKTRVYAYWLTAAHVGSRGKCSVMREGKRQLAGQVVAARNSSDLALVKTTAYTVTEDPMPIWIGQLKGRAIYGEGYASGSFRDFGRRRGSFTSFYKSRGTWSLPSIPGESGGCLYVPYRGLRYICGVTSTSDWPSNRRGHRNGETNGAHHQEIRNFLSASGLPVGADGFVGGKSFTLGGRGWCDPIQGCNPGQPVQPIPQIDPGQGFIVPQQPNPVDYEKIKQLIADEVAKIPTPVDGVDGLPGNDGLPGKDGAQGPQGPPGPSVAGPQGPRGDIGPAGPKGDTGESGAPGVGINSMEIQDGNLVVLMSDGSVRDLGPMGFDVQIYGTDRQLLTEQYVAPGGTLKLQNKLIE